MDAVRYLVLHRCILNISHAPLRLMSNALFIKYHACVEPYIDSWIALHFRPYIGC